MKKRRIFSALMIGIMVTGVVGCAKNTTEQKAATEATDKTQATDAMKGTESTQATDTAAATDTAQSGEQVEITYWHSYSEGEEKIFKDKVLPDFESKYKNIKVNAVRMPYEGMDQQLITAVTGDSAPDVMRMDITWEAQMAKLGVLEQVDQMDGFSDLKSNILPASMSTNIYNGKYYGLPLDANTTFAIYNKEELNKLGFEQPPVTLDELMKAENKTDPAKQKWLFAIQGSYNWAMLPFIWTLGGSITNDDFTKATGYLNSDATVKALETINGWYQKKIIGPSILGEQPDTWGGIDGGNYAMIVEGPWYFSSADPDKVKDRIPALIPSVDGRSISIIGGQDVAMIKNTKHKDAVWTFMKYLLEDAPQLAMSESGMIPVTNSALGNVDTSDKPYIKVCIDQLKTAKPRTPSANWPSIEKELNNAFESVLRGKATAKDALDSAAAKIDDLLKNE